MFILTLKKYLLKLLFIFMLYLYVGSFQRRFRVTFHEGLQLNIFYSCCSFLHQVLLEELHY